MVLRFTDIPNVQIRIVDDAGIDIHVQLPVLPPLGEKLDDAVGALGAVDEGRSRALYYFDAVKGIAVKRIKVSGCYLHPIQQHNRRRLPVDGVDPAQHNVDVGPGRTTRTGDLRTGDLPDQCLVYGGWWRLNSSLAETDSAEIPDFPLPVSTPTPVTTTSLSDRMSNVVLTSITMQLLIGTSCQSE